ncbi:uncharacterized protein LOC106162807 [Lingula anatina]|uniref:Uncharacterized protein LOC106162807 n=1 Tax=Lingula anatina TaxID=7574 RepID=A0A1S3ICV1_LINAN|nr:uncharacterized protein LOC106162807 [Lingula anatina]|eukprot:XP_013395686.1 uncharacterized protein LOC106162807 [Lingula anatina]
MIMNFHGRHFQHRPVHEYDEPPMIPIPSSLYSDQSTTTDGLYASIRPSNITTVGPASFDDFSEDDNSHEEQHTSRFYGKLKRLRFYLMAIFIMCCLQMIAIVVMGAVIHLHRHDGDKASTGELLGNIEKNDHTGVLRNMSRLATGSQERRMNNITQKLDSLESMFNGLQANVTDLLQSSRKDSIPLTLAHLIGWKTSDTSRFTWRTGPHTNSFLTGDVRYNVTKGYLTVGREGHFLVYSQLCLRGPKSGTFDHQIQKYSGDSWKTGLYKARYYTGSSRIDCDTLTGIMHLRENDSIRVDLSKDNYITGNSVFNSFGLYMLSSL